MAGYKSRVIALTKRPGQTFGFFLRVERGEEGHLIRCLEMGGPAELAGLKDGDRILRVNGTYVDGISHSQVVDMVRDSGPSVTFHVMDAASYKKAIAENVDLSEPQARPAVNGVAGQAPKPKLCYLAKSVSGYGFSLRSSGQQGAFITQVAPGGVAERAGVKNSDRVLEVNGENIEASTHDSIVDKVKAAGSGSGIMLLLVDEETDKYYKNKRIRIVPALATVKLLPHPPRIADLTKGSDGYGFFLRVEPNKTGHFIKDIDRGSPAEKGGLKEMDRLVAVNGQGVEDCSHEQVVDRIRQSGVKCCLLVVDSDTDNMYKMGGVSPMLFLEERDLPPSYPEAVSLPTVVRPATPVKEKDQDQDTPVKAKDQGLKPKLCTMEKTPVGYGFHLNGIQGVCGQYIKEVVRGGAADRAGLEEDDIVVEVNGVNVEKSTHEAAVELIRKNSSCLEMLVATKSVYDQLKADGVAITRALLLGHTSAAQVHVPATSEEVKKETPATLAEATGEDKEEKEEARPETPPAPARERTPSVSSASSEGSIDERL